MRLAVSFSTTRFSLLRKGWAESESKGNLIQPAGDENIAGGLVIILNWDTGICELTKQINQATGICQTRKGFLIASDKKLYVTNKNLKTKRIIENALFNNIHGIFCSQGCISLASSGIDSIIFLNKHFKNSYIWCALENGYSKKQNGKNRKLDLSDDHSAVFYPTTEHATHLNSVWHDFDNDEIYTTLFWQGEIIRFSRSNDRITTLGRDFKFPHSLSRDTQGGWCFADTGNNRIVLTDDWSSFNFIDIPNASWVQDVTPIGSGKYIVADANNCRLIEIDKSGVVIKEWRYHPEWKVFESKLLQ